MVLAVKSLTADDSCDPCKRGVVDVASLRARRRYNRMGSRGIWLVLSADFWNPDKRLPIVARNVVRLEEVAAERKSVDGLRAML